MKSLAAVIFTALSLASAAPAIPPPVMEDGGGTGWSCRWYPYAYWNGVWWVGQFWWFDLPGNPTGIPCV